MKMRLYSGFLIPVCDREGYIQGLQIRLDDVSVRKYRWFSSNHCAGGSRAYSWVHVSRAPAVPPRTVYITEGALKADVAASLSGKLFTAVPGVKALDLLPGTLRGLGVSRAVEALDMDKRINANVAAAADRIRDIVTGAALDFFPFEWDSRYKGIDDYLNRNAA